MSGGSFGYAFRRVEEFVEDLEKLMEEGEEFEVVTMKALEEIKELVRIAAKFMKEVEWLYSGDNGEETFCKRLEEIAARSGKEDGED